MMNLEAERSTLGGLMLDNSAYDRVAPFLVASDFADRKHQLIYSQIEKISSKGLVFDPVVLTEAMGSAANDAGGLAYIGEIAKNTPSAANVVAYAKIVFEKSARRKLIANLSEALDLVRNADDIGQAIDQAQSLILEIGVNDDSQRIYTSSEIIPKVLDRLEERSKNPGALTGLPTGFNDLDQILFGLNSPDLIIVAARPSQGKTALALNIAQYVAIKKNLPVLFASCEMGIDELNGRAICSEGEIDFSRYRSGQLLNDDWLKINTASTSLANAPLCFIDGRSMQINRLRTMARRQKRKYGMSLLVVDYLQLLKARGETREREVSEITAGLKSLAKELHVPVLALSQLNRSLESRPNKRPVLSDLRDSGAIEQDADVIAFIYRDEMYNEVSRDKGMGEVIIAKHRNGELGTVKLKFKGHYCRFENL